MSCVIYCERSKQSSPKGMGCLDKYLDDGLRYGAFFVGAKFIAVSRITAILITGTLVTDTYFEVSLPPDTSCNLPVSNSL
jgi:hypothetical protein